MMFTWEAIGTSESAFCSGAGAEAPAVLGVRLASVERSASGPFLLKFTRCNLTRRNWPEELLTPRHKYFGYFTFHCVSATKMVRTVTIGLSSAMHLALSMKKRRIARLIMMSKTKKQYWNSQRYRHRLVNRR